MVNSTALDLLGLPRGAILGRGTRDLTEMPESTDIGMAALAAGAIDSYHATRRIRLPDDTERDVSVWVRWVDDHPTRYAVTLMLPVGGDDVAVRTVARQFGPEAHDLSVGTTDSTSRIDNAASTTELILGREASAAIGTHLLDLVHPADAERFSAGLLHVADGGDTDAVVVARLRHLSGEWILTRCMFFRGPNAAADSVGFALTEPAHGAAPAEQAERAAALERHLHRISAELHGAGLLPGGPVAAPDAAAEESRVLADLPDRQREIVTRLMHGERVPGIAAEMHLSPATVRNHLTRVFEKFGVHSQAEMITLLRRGSGDAPAS